MNLYHQSVIRSCRCHSSSESFTWHWYLCEIFVSKKALRDTSTALCEIFVSKDCEGGLTIGIYAYGLPCRRPACFNNLQRIADHDSITVCSTIMYSIFCLFGHLFEDIMNYLHYLSIAHWIAATNDVEHDVERSSKSTHHRSPLL
jgi:hypothetical protein